MVSVLILNSNCPFWRYVGLCLKSYPRVIRLLLLSCFVLAFLPYLPPRWNNLVSLPKTHPHLGFSFGPWLPPALGSHSIFGWCVFRYQEKRWDPRTSTPSWDCFQYEFMFEGLLCVKHNDETFSCLISLKLHDKPMEWVLLAPCLLQAKTSRFRRVSNLPQIAKSRASREEVMYIVLVLLKTLPWK